MKIRKLILPLLSAGILLSGLFIGGIGFAHDDDDDDHHGERHEQHEKHEKGGRYAVAENAVYKQECSSCHFLYLPGLLPAKSWHALMQGTDKHFGENLGLDEKTKNEILAFLTANSAEKTNTEWANKIVKSAGSTAPAKITDVPWIAKEHRKITPEVFKRASIGSRSNCGACHPNASQGDFEEDAISIPRK